MSRLYPWIGEQDICDRPIRAPRGHARAALASPANETARDAKMRPPSLRTLAILEATERNEER
jgi:hypothetical protein